MGYTKYGEFMRILRIKNHEVMGDTAKLLGVKLPFVSAVESGKRNVPVEWIEIITDKYSLTPDEQNELIRAVEESRTQIKIDMTAADVHQRQAAVLFQRSFEKLDAKTAKEIINLLSGEDA